MAGMGECDQCVVGSSLVDPVRQPMLGCVGTLALYATLPIFSGACVTNVHLVA